MRSTCLLLSLAGTAWLAGRAGPVRADVDFQREVRPILAANCFQCHGPDDKTRQSGLRLDQQDASRRAGDSGLAAIVPGKPEASELLRRLTAADANERMPPPETKKTLMPAQIDVLRRWIQEGAVYASHWAFVPPRRPPPPQVRDASCARGAIDRFILARLDREGLAPSPEASRSFAGCTWT